MKTKLDNLAKNFNFEHTKENLPFQQLPCPCCEGDLMENEQLLFNFSDHSFWCESCGELSQDDVLDAIMERSSEFRQILSNFFWLLSRCKPVENGKSA